MRSHRYTHPKYYLFQGTSGGFRTLTENFQGLKTNGFSRGYFLTLTPPLKLEGQDSSLLPEPRKKSLLHGRP
jgi:hypothetical protein